VVGDAVSLCAAVLGFGLGFARAGRFGRLKGGRIRTSEHVEVFWR
jgi:hypothetical protein